MESPGQYIKREREHRGFTLADIHEATKVPMKLLIALEADDFDALPHPTFVKGFIRSYSRHLGIDEDDAVLRYELFIKEKAERPAEAEEADRPSLTIKPAEPSGSRNVIVFVAVGVMVIIVFYIGSTLRDRKEEAPTDRQPAVAEEARDGLETGPAPGTDTPTAPAAALPQEAAVPVRQAPARAPEEQAPAVARKHTLSIDALDEVWVEVTIDDSVPFDVTLQKGERIEWKAAEKFFLVLGNAGGVELTFDGELMPRPGEPGKVRRITLPGWEPGPGPAAPPAAPEPGHGTVPEKNL